MVIFGIFYFSGGGCPRKLQNEKNKASGNGNGNVASSVANGGEMVSVAPSTTDGNVGNGLVVTDTPSVQDGNVGNGGGLEEPQAKVARTVTDPYSVDLGTPHRARPLMRSTSVDSIDGRSDRSRTTSGSRTRMRYKQANPNKENQCNVLCPVEAGFSRRESLPILTG